MNSVECNYRYERLSQEELLKIEDRIYLSKYNCIGVYEADRGYLELVDIAYDRIADRLETIVSKYYRTKGEKCTVEDVYSVSPAITIVD